MEGKTHTTIGKVSLTLGLISFLLIILTAFVTYGTYIGIIASNVIIVVGYLGYFFAIPAAIIAIILGFIAWKKGDKYGLIGLILGLIVIILFIISIIMSAFLYVYVSGMLPNSYQPPAPQFLDMHQIAAVSNGWVNLTTDNATAGLEWSDLKITVGGVNFSVPTETMQPAIGHCGYTGILGVGGKLYVHGTTEQITAGLNLIVTYEISFDNGMGRSSGSLFAKIID